MVAAVASSARDRGSLAAVAARAGEVARRRATRCGRGRTARVGAGSAVGNLSMALLGLVCVCGCFGRRKELAANKLVQRNLARF